MTLQFPRQTHRYLSGSCDEKKNIDKKRSSSVTAGEDKDLKDKGSRSEEGPQPSSEGSSEPETEHRLGSQESGQVLNPEESDAGLNGQEVAVSSQEGQQEPSVEGSADKDKKKGDRKMYSLKVKFKRKLAKRLTSWDKINESFEAFPYYLSEHTRDILIESAVARLYHFNLAKFGRSLRTSSHLILLSGPPGTEIYQEKLVKALARHLQTSLLVLDSDLLAAEHCKEEILFAESESREDEEGDRTETKDGWELAAVHDSEDDDDDVERSNGKRLPQADNFVQELERLVKQQVFHESASGSEGAGCMNKADKKDEEQDLHQDTVKIGDHVKYIGRKDTKGSKRRANPRVGQQGLVTSVSDECPLKVGVKFEGGSKKGGASSKKNNSCVVICDVKELEKTDAKCSEREPWMMPIEAFSELISSSGGGIVYFPDIQKWMARAVPPDERSLFLHTLGDFLNRLKGSVVCITGRIKVQSTTNSAPFNPMRNLLSSMRSPGFRRYRLHLKDDKEEELKGTEDVFDIFKNVIPIVAPQGQDVLREWREQIEQDKKTILLRNNLKELQKVLAENSMKCAEITNLDTSDLRLTEKLSQKVVGWARNICLSDGHIQQKGRNLCLPQESLEKALARLRAIAIAITDKLADVKTLAENEYERELTSSVVRAKDIGVTFDQIGALEDVKNTLNELIILPLKRPELFKKGNLRKPCKGVLLFGPPGTGKTLLAKAVATEAGANFMSINTSNITSKWFGDAEKLARALFTLARKLEPAIIFIDEVDSILRARGDASEHEASRRVRNELMAAWDGLQSKESERILVLATTNRPFDLDDAVIRRLPRRVFVDLPDAENRIKILHVLLAEEGLGDNFNFSELAVQTEGYSGSDLKNLCVAAAYRPIREYLEAEKQANVDEFSVNAAERKHHDVALRPLCLEDFIQAKKKIGMSIAYDASSMIQMRQWNEQYGEGGSRTKSVFGFVK